FEREHSGEMELPAQVKVGREEEISEEAVETTLRRALRYYSTLQAEDGHWPGDYAGPLFLLPGLVRLLLLSSPTLYAFDAPFMLLVPSNRLCFSVQDVLVHSPKEEQVIGLSVIGALDTGLPENHQREIRRYLYNHQVLGVYEWSGNNPLPPEIWLLPYFLPIHPGLFHINAQMCVGYNGSQLWDVVFAVQAILETNLIDKSSLMLRRAHEYIKNSQVALLLSQMPSNIVGEPIAQDGLFNAVNLILTLQNNNGGFATYELTRSYDWLEVINPAETFGDIIIDYQYVECTSAAIQGLGLFMKLYPVHRRQEIEACITKAVRFIESIQLPDGSWYVIFPLC
ncbi:hypothetical protein RJ639_011016, partial [Escallonia herrerae]